MAYTREEHRVVEDSTAGDPVVTGYRSRANPAPIIAAICIAALLIFLVLFGMSRVSSDGDSNTNDGPTITLPDNENDGGSNNTSNTNGSNSSDTGTSSNTKTSVQNSTP